MKFKHFLSMFILCISLPVSAQSSPPVPAQESTPTGGMVAGMTGGGLGIGFSGLNWFTEPASAPQAPATPSTPAEGASTHSLNRNCRPAGSNFACGECDTNVQTQFNDLIADITGQTQSGGHWSQDLTGQARIRDGVTLEGTLARITEMMKGADPSGGNGLNFIVIGESESLQPTTVRDGKMYPRITVKSPNSELWVTFGTDPQDPTYSTLEIMRWNGKDAKYQFMELDFAPQNRHMDGSGQKCLSCHKEPDPRPNWDTYRAWSGVVPSRDDMLELHAQNGQYVRGEGERIGSDGRAYLSFLEQVVDAKENNPTDRLALLNIPVDDQVQFAGRTPPVSSLPPRQQLEAIRAQTEREGFYRIPHYPYTQQMTNTNFDGKTADYSGPSQIAFDNMSGQNFCRISQRLKEHPEYDKFKYYLAGISSCGGARNPERMQEWIPESFQNGIMGYYGANPAVHLRNLTQAGRPTNFNDFSDLVTRINEDTDVNHSRANEFKVERHTRFLESYLQGVEGGTPEAVRSEAREFSSTLTAPTHDYPRQFHAISDSGGVNGVGEDSGPQISGLRAVLGPLGVNVGQWSMMRGNDPNYDSLAFSDQFSLLYGQAAVTEVIAEVRREMAANGESDLCDALQERSYNALASLPLNDANGISTDNDFDIQSWCRERVEAEALGESLGFSDNMKALFEVNRSMLAEESKDLTVRCFNCHGKDSGMEFPGMENQERGSTWTDENWQIFNSALRGESGQRDYPLGAMVVEKMLLSRMPPGGWRVGETHEQRRAEDTRRREVLANYTKLTIVTSSNEGAIRSYCSAVVSEEYLEEQIPLNSPSKPSQAVSQ